MCDKSDEFYEDLAINDYKVKDCTDNHKNKKHNNSNKENVFECEAQKEKSSVIKINNVDIRCFA